MKITNNLIEHNNKTAVALGIFDGLHIGHTAVIRQTTVGGFAPTVLTFGGKVKDAKRIITEKTKTQILESLGVNEYITLPFDEIKDMLPQDFVAQVLVKKLNAAKVCCGFNFRFGKNASGDATLLKALCEQYDIEVFICEPVELDGVPVSSTVIRKLLLEGDVTTANKMLGHPFGYEYEVVGGKKLGRVLGTPTLNQHFDSDFCVPKFGVYASYAVYGGKKYPSVTNIGVKPTVGSEFPLSETWIPDFSGDLYGQHVEVRLLEFMRAEEKFSSIDALKEKILSDGEKSKRIFEKYNKKRVLVGMSGGVDSSVAALLLKQQGYDVSGLTLKLHNSNDANDAKRVCDVLEIEHFELDLTADFDKYVLKNFTEEYQNGKTPNPCVVCNKFIKFGKMLDFAVENGFDYIATGHYAVIEEKDGEYFLKRSPSMKDQSYFLYRLGQFELAHSLFPLGEIADKEQTRRLAQEYALPVAFKPDSQDICFIEDGDYAKFLEEYGNVKPVFGDFIDQNGNVLGQHRGIIHFTVGQRKGLGMGFGRPMYVTKINPDDNTVTLGEEGSQYSISLIAENINIVGSPFEGEKEVQAKVRSAAKPAPAKIRIENNEIICVFDEPQRAVTPGQSVVFYDGDTVIGGGTVKV